MDSPKQVNLLTDVPFFFAWLRMPLGLGERADGCVLQPCAVLTLLAMVLWEPGADHHCVGLPVVPSPHSSASWLAEIA